MQHGKFVVKAKQTKIHRKEFDRKSELREHVKLKHHDKALLRSKREEQRNDFLGMDIDEGY